MLLWMLMVVGELTGSHYFSANGWFIFTIICWLWHVCMSNYDIKLLFYIRIGGDEDG